MRKIIYLITKMLFMFTLTYTSEWSYKDQNNWVIEYGKYQSPINIESENVITSKDYKHLDIKLNSKFIIEDNGHTINLKGSGISVLNKRVFNFIGKHIHSPSEHQINGISYPMEFHFVHVSPNNKIGVIGVLVEIGTENKEFQKILDHLKRKKIGEAVNINFDLLLPRNRGYYHYLGSLTTPPLSENVEWYIINEHIEISRNQLKEFNNYYLNNNRKIQELKGRDIIELK